MSVKAGWQPEPLIGRSKTGAQESPLVALCCDLATVQMPPRNHKISRFRLCYTFIWIVISTMHIVDVYVV